MSDQQATPTTVEQVREQAEQIYYEANPKFAPPVPPDLARPGVVHIGKAHAWIDVMTDDTHYREAAKARAKFFIVQRDGGSDQRIEGEMNIDDLEDRIRELTRAIENVDTKQRFVAAAARYEKLAEAYERDKKEFVRQRVAEFEKSAKK